jgi:hypothetical protein
MSEGTDPFDQARNPPSSPGIAHFFASFELEPTQKEQLKKLTQHYSKTVLNENEAWNRWKRYCWQHKHDRMQQQLKVAIANSMLQLLRAIFERKLRSFVTRWCDGVEVVLQKTAAVEMIQQLEFAIQKRRLCRGLLHWQALATALTLRCGRIATLLALMFQRLTWQQWSAHVLECKKIDNYDRDAKREAAVLTAGSMLIKTVLVRIHDGLVQQAWRSWREHVHQSRQQNKRGKVQLAAAAMLAKVLRHMWRRGVGIKWDSWQQHTQNSQMYDAQQRQLLQQLENLETHMPASPGSARALSPALIPAHTSILSPAILSPVLQSVLDICGSVDARSPQRQVESIDGSPKCYLPASPPVRGASFESVGHGTATKLAAAIAGDVYGQVEEETAGKSSGDQAIALQTFFYRLKESHILLLSQGWSKWLDFLLLTEVQLTHSEGWEAHDQTCATLTLEIETLLQASEEREAEHELALRELVERQGTLVEEALASGLAAKEVVHARVLRQAVGEACDVVSQALGADLAAVTSRSLREEKERAVRMIGRFLKTLVKTICRLVWVLWRESARGHRRAAVVLVRCVKKRTKENLGRAWGNWIIANLNMLHAGGVIHQVLSRFSRMQMLTAWFRWRKLREARKGAVAVMRRCLVQGDNKRIRVALDNWKDSVKWYRAQAVTAAAGSALERLERLREEFEREKKDKGSGLLKRTLRKMGVRIIARGWNGWVAALQREIEAAETIEQCLIQLETSALDGAWRQWCVVHTESIQAGEVILELANRMNTKLLVAGWCGWMDTLKYDQRGAALIESCVARFERMALARGMRRWLSANAAEERASLVAGAVSVALAAQAEEHEAALRVAVTRALADQQAKSDDFLCGAVSEATTVAEKERGALVAAHEKSKQDWLSTLKSMKARETSDFLNAPETNMGCQIVFATQSRQRDGVLRQAWAQWITRTHAMSSAAQVMQASLNRICNGAMASGWSRWVEFVDARNVITLEHYRVTRFITTSVRRVARHILYDSWAIWQDYLCWLVQEYEQTVHSQHVRKLCFTIDSTRKRWAARRLKACLRSCYRIRLKAYLRVWQQVAEDTNTMVLTLAADCATSLSWLRSYFSELPTCDVTTFGNSRALVIGSSGSTSFVARGMMTPGGAAWEPDLSRRSTPGSRLMIPSSRGNDNTGTGRQAGQQCLEIVEAVLRQQQALLNDMDARAVSMNEEFQRRWHKLQSENQRAHSMNSVLGKEAKKWQKKAQDMFVLAKTAA